MELLCGYWLEFKKYIYKMWDLIINSEILELIGNQQWNLKCNLPLISINNKY